MEKFVSSGIDQKCKVTGISERQLRQWEEAGYISPETVVFGERIYRRYSQDDMDFIRENKNYLDEGYRLRRPATKNRNEKSEERHCGIIDEPCRLEECTYYVPGRSFCMVKYHSYHFIERNGKIKIRVSKGKYAKKWNEYYKQQILTGKVILE